MFTTPNNAVMSSPKTAKTFQSRSAMMFKRGSARLLRRRSAAMFQEVSALMSPRGSVAPFPRRNARTSPSFSVFRCLRSAAKNSTDSLVLRFQRKIANKRQDVSVIWCQKFQPRKSLNASAQLTRRMCVNLSPKRFAVLSVNLMKSAMISLRRYALPDQQQLPSTSMMNNAPRSPQESVKLLQGKNARMLWSRFQGKLSRLNAKLSSHKNALALDLNPEVDLVDMETKNLV